MTCPGIFAAIEGMDLATGFEFDAILTLECVVSLGF